MPLYWNINQAYHASEVGDFKRPTRKLLLNQAYQAFELEILNQIYQKNLVKPGLPGFLGGKFQPGLPGKPGDTKLTKHFWLGFLSRDLSYQTFMVNYNQAYLESLVKPGSTRLSILVDNCQKPGKSGSTRVYQAHQAFNQTFGARVAMVAVHSPQWSKFWKWTRCKNVLILREQSRSHWIL